MQYLLSATLLAGLALVTGSEGVAWTDNLTTSLPTSSTAPVISRSRHLTTSTYGDGKILSFLAFIIIIVFSSLILMVGAYQPVVLLAF